MNLLQKLQEQRDAKQAKLTEIRTAAEARADGEQNLTEDEARDFDALLTEIRALDERIDSLLEDEQRQAAAAERREKIIGAAGPAVVDNEARTYRPDVRSSYFADLYRSGKGDVEARERLNRHAQEVDVEARKADTFEARALDRTDGSGGTFVPPSYLIGDYEALARAGRVFADGCNKHELPAGTDTIKVPRVIAGTAVAAQADNATVNEQDLDDDYVTANVNTIAGQQGVALQLIDQSPIGFDSVVFADLTADYAVKLDTQTVSGAGTGGTHQGVLTLVAAGTGISVTYTDASPTPGELYAKIADSLQRIHSQRFMPPTRITMAPRRWAFFLGALDGQGRPLVVPSVQGPMNAMASHGGVDSEGPVGFLQGLPVYVDPNIPTNLGAGTNEDRIIIDRAPDVHLWEGALRSRALEQTRGDKLQVLLQVYAYSAFMPDRQPKSLAVISGTGLVTPSF